MSNYKLTIESDKQIEIGVDIKFNYTEYYHCQLIAKRYNASYFQIELQKVWSLDYMNEKIKWLFKTGILQDLDICLTNLLLYNVSVNLKDQDGT